MRNGIVFRAAYSISMQSLLEVYTLKEIRLFDSDLLSISVLLISVLFDDGIISIILGLVKMNLNPFSIVIFLDFNGEFLEE